MEKNIENLKGTVPELRTKPSEVADSALSPSCKTHFQSKHIKRILSILIISAIFYFMGHHLYRNWEKVSGHNFNLDWYLLSISILLLPAYFFFKTLVWNWILFKMGAAISLRKCCRILFLTQLGKYLPGKVWPVLGRVYMCEKEGVSKREAFTSVLLESIFEIITGALVFFFFVFLVFKKELGGGNMLGILSAVIFLGILILHPRIFYKILNYFLAKLGREEVKETLNYKNSIWLFILYTFVLLFEGVSFYILVNAIFYVSPDKFLALTGMLAMAGIMGLISIFTPAGLGVREGVLAALLSYYLPLHIAIIISLMARIWITSGELICAGIAWRL
jgi:uncharacterized membrane protein YbhN (UPF0104 family)